MTAAIASPRGQSSIVRRVRLFTGLVLFGFVSSHLFNHSLGLISLAAMESGRLAFLAFWRHPLPSLLLQTCLLTHLALAFCSLYRRRSLRMPLWKALQLTLGLFIPLVLIATGRGPLPFSSSRSCSRWVCRLQGDAPAERAARVLSPRNCALD